MKIKTRRSYSGRYWSVVAQRLLIAVALATVAVPSFSASVRAEIVHREILAVYDSTFEATPGDTLIHARAEMPLNHLGYVLDFHDAQTGLPDPQTLSRYAAVITWFTYDVNRPAEYLAWARKATEANIPFIVLGQTGVPGTPRNVALFNRILKPMGIELTSGFVEATFGTTILRSDPSIVGYEHPLGDLLPAYPIIRPVSNNAQVLLEVQGPPREHLARSALVTAGPSGAFVPAAFALYSDATLGRTQWLVDPFSLFERVLGKSQFPVPDTTTVSGRRLYFSHVDGDGWNDSVDMERYKDPQILAAEVMKRELIEPYPELPVTVGLISADLDDAYGPAEKAAATARSLFSLPQVQSASHTATSPLVWSFYENYSQIAEETLIHDGSSGGGVGKGLLHIVTDALGVTQVLSDSEQKRAMFVSGGRRLPRAYFRDPFSLQGEIAGSVETIAGLTPAGKVVDLLQWSGDAKPYEAALKAARTAGLRNINGGGARLDDEYPSVGYVSAIARTVGGERQIYSVDADDSSFMNTEGGGNSAGYSAIETTLQRTESPRRLKGIDLHYHVYSAKKQASLNAIKHRLDWARNAPVAPITASDYAAIADGFFTTRIEADGPSDWTISDRGGLQTVRFDDIKEASPDLTASRGIVGSTVYQGSLYIALDADVPDARISFKSKPDETGSPAGTTAVQLESARWQVRGLLRKQCGFSFVSHGYGEGAFVWKDLSPGDYRVNIEHDSASIWQQVVKVDSEGRLDFIAPASALEPLLVSIDCEPKRAGGQS